MFIAITDKTNKIELTYIVQCILFMSLYFTNDPIFVFKPDLLNDT